VLAPNPTSQHSGAGSVAAAEISNSEEASEPPLKVFIQMLYIVFPNKNAILETWPPRMC